MERQKGERISDAADKEEKSSGFAATLLFQAMNLSHFMGGWVSHCDLEPFFRSTESHFCTKSLNQYG
jgi:hypothetical protein